MRSFLLFAAIALLGSCSAAPVGTNGSNSVNKPAAAPAATQKIPVSTYEIVKAYPHDGRAFTQGLVFHDGYLYESTGELGESTLRKVEIETGKAVQKISMPTDVFAEGMTILGDKIYQISWQNHKAWQYDLAFKTLNTFSYQGEGWGLTHDGKNLILSDGTHLLKFIDPETFKLQHTIAVMHDGRPLYLLNELEMVKGEIWANIWHSEEKETGTTQGLLPNLGRPNMIARIDPANGNVVGWIDLSGISPRDQEGDRRAENTLNGIAYDAAGDRIFVTGKNWKNLYEIKLKPKE